MTSKTGVVAPPARSLSAKVPEITVLFWVIKILTTGMGETFSDFLVTHFVPEIAVGLAGLVLVISLIAQFRASGYHVWTYWSAVVMVSIFGTMVADITSFIIGIPLLAATLVFAVILAVIFALWYASEKTLSVHSITTRRREGFYWATVMATFALGTVAGDLTAVTLHLGYLTSAVVFAIAIAIPAVAHRWGGLGVVTAFWSAYVVTRPLGASITDWLASSRADGLALGTGWVTLGTTIAILALLAILAARTTPVADRAPADLPDPAARREDS
ncbi:hypothetical protein ACFWF7_14490 [Nocardia sp. NPDC060256]|uniref:COG4705 family protein n=1 Tax=unclassified Nocardia TaxID=2637762 RepID=UPI0036462A2F